MKNKSATSRKDAQNGLIKSQNHIIAGLKENLKACYINGNNTLAEFEQCKNISINGTNATEFLQLKHDLQTCTTDLKNCETGVLENILRDQLNKSWCKGYGVVSDYLFCPLENSVNYLHQNFWQPLPTPVQYIIVGSVIIASGYGIYSYFKPIAAAAVDAAAITAATAAEYKAAGDALLNQIGVNGIKIHVKHIKEYLHDPNAVITYISNVPAASKATLVTFLNNLQDAEHHHVVHDYLIHQGGDQALEVLGNIAEAAAQA